MVGLSRVTMKIWRLLLQDCLLWLGDIIKLGLLFCLCAGREFFKPGDSDTLNQVSSSESGSGTYTDSESSDDNTSSPSSADMSGSYVLESGDTDTSNSSYDTVSYEESTTSYSSDASSCSALA